VREKEREREREQYCACQIVGRTNMTGCLAHTQTYYFERIRVKQITLFIFSNTNPFILSIY
jgi:hypothetical protein